MNAQGRMKFVVDASVILKWFSQEREKDHENALRIREDFRARKIDLYAPGLLIYETANVLRYKETLKDDLVLKAIDSIYAMDILIPVNLQIMKNALKLARQFEITVYDSAYLSCAQYSGCYLITADKRFYQKLKDVPGILYISGYDSQAD
jgi:predicted nucleic acid-binding protein